MKPSKLFLFEIMVLVLFIFVQTMAQPITFTGDVENDFPEEQEGVLVIPDPGNPGGNPGEITAGDNTSGWDIKDLRLSYDADSDILYIGVNSFGIVGDVDGNGDPNTSASAEYTEESYLCGGESVAVYFDLDMHPEPYDPIESWDVIAGVRYGVEVCYDYFVVAEWDTWPGEFNPPFNFGPPLADQC